MNPRPKILLDYGRVNEPIRVPISDLLLSMPMTYLTNDTAAGVTSVTIANGDELFVGTNTTPYVIIGQPGNQNTENCIPIDVLSDTTVTLLGETQFPHSASTPVYGVLYDGVEISYASSIDGSKSVYAAALLVPAQMYAIFTNDGTLPDSGYYFARWHDSVNGVFSPYSDPAPYDSYTIYSARSIIDSALSEINKTTSEVLSDQFAFQQLDAFQTDVLKELKRWSFMQKFDSIIGQVSTDSWSVDCPADIEDPNTNQSIYNVRIGTEARPQWIDKAKWDDFVFNLAYSTLSVNLNAGDVTMTLVNSGDFNHLTNQNTDGTGTVKINGNSYNYTANDTSTGILTLSTTITSANDAVAGDNVFQNANEGLPQYYTVFDGKIWYCPITSSEYDGHNIYLDYYTKQIRIRHDSDEIIVPDALMASLYLQWKFLKKLNNGDEDAGSLSIKGDYLARREKLKSKKVLNRTFQLKPQFQNFSIMEQSDNGDPRYVRDGSFPNTGF